MATKKIKTREKPILLKKFIQNTFLWIEIIPYTMINERELSELLIHNHLLFQLKNQLVQKYPISNGNEFFTSWQICSSSEKISQNSTLHTPAKDEEKFQLLDLQWTICLSKECSSFSSQQARHFYMKASNPYMEDRWN